MGQDYLVIIYTLKNREFSPLETAKFLPDEESDYNDYKIKYFNNNYIILNNFKKKIIYIIVENGFYLIKKEI